MVGIPVPEPFQQFAIALVPIGGWVGRFAPELQQTLVSVDPAAVLGRPAPLTRPWSVVVLRGQGSVARGTTPLATGYLHDGIPKSLAKGGETNPQVSRTSCVGDRGPCDG